MSHPHPEQANPSGELRPLSFPAVPPPPVLGENGPPQQYTLGPPPPQHPAPPPAGYSPPPAPGGYGPPPPPPGPPRPLPAKKSNAGVIVIVVVAVLALCGLGAFGGWYAFLGGDDTVDGMTAGSPSYPQSYKAQVPPTAPGAAHQEPGGGGLCKEVDRLRVGYVLSVDNWNDTTRDYGDSRSHQCTLNLTNVDEYGDEGATGTFRVSAQFFEDEARAAQDFATNADLHPVALPTDGLDIPAIAFDASDTATRQVLVQVHDGNLLLTAEFIVNGAGDGVRAEVLRVVVIDTINEVAAKLAA
ncbi:hypothetical protein AB0I28_22325 [Phytomonospora sp. NPDC050363]|uniref:hypothetical protein n=1 Tax=Phytomonospora sp. NPDC050363 TaxID=3155642 RepID=UPI0033D0652F